MSGVPIPLSSRVAVPEGGKLAGMRTIVVRTPWSSSTSQNGRPCRSSSARALESGKGFGHFHHAAYTIGAAYAVMNRPREAVRWLRAAADDGFPCYPLYERDRALDKVRADEHFVQLMKDLKGRWDHYKSLS